MKRKMLPKKNAPNGLYLYCSKHRRWYKNDNVVKCKCDLKYKAKVHVPGTKRNSRIKTFEADSTESAIQIFEEFKKDLRKTNFHLVQIEEKIIKPIYFLDCVQEFIDYKNDIGVDYQERKNLPRRNIRNAERALEYFTYAMVENGIKPEILKFESINSKIAGFVVEYLEVNRKFKNKTYNNNLQNIKGFMRYIIEKHYPNLDNPFKKIPFKKVVPKARAIKISDFNRMIELVSPENGYGFDYKGKRLNFYRTWIIDAFYLGMFTGGRQEETVVMKWSDIIYNDEGRISSVAIKDLKINRKLKNSIDNENYVLKYVEMSPEFEQLLYSMGFEDKKDSDEYILAPEETMKRDYMSSFVSRAFSHFYSLLNLEDGLSFKHLRKSFVTKNFIENQEEFYKKSGHTSKAIALKHYVDMTMVLEEQRKRRYGEI